MTCETGPTSSDSVNLGSNPSSPATRTADVSGTSHATGDAEKSEQSEQTAHTGRTETGTAPEWHDYADDLDNEYEDDDDDDEFLAMECGLHADGQCALAGTEHCDFTCPWRDSEDFAGSEAWRKKHAARSPAPPFAGCRG